MENLFPCRKKCDSTSGVKKTGLAHPNLYSLWTGSRGGRKKFDKQSESMSAKVTKNSARRRVGKGALSPFRAHREPVRKLQFVKHLLMTPPFRSPCPITNVPSPLSKPNNNLWILPGLVSRSLMMITTGSCRIAAGLGSWGWTKVRPLSVSITKV